MVRRKLRHAQTVLALPWLFACAPKQNVFATGHLIRWAQGSAQPHSGATPGDPHTFHFHLATARCAPATLSVAAAYPGVTIPHGWTARVWSIVTIWVIRPRCDCAPDHGARDGPSCHSTPEKRTGSPASPPRIRGAQCCQCRRADDCCRDHSVPNLSHAITPELTSQVIPDSGLQLVNRADLRLQ
jgi:hypothetical protein